jgi:hypothetical protein
MEGILNTSFVSKCHYGIYVGQTFSNLTRFIENINNIYIYIYSNKAIIKKDSIIYVQIM